VRFGPGKNGRNFGEVPVKQFILIGLLACLGVCGVPMAATAVNVLTYHNDNARTGQNTNETSLTPANVNTNSFGPLFTYAVDGYIYGQPLVMTGVTIPGSGVHNVVFVATEHDSVYAFDADSNAGPNSAPLWQVSFLNPGAGVTTVTTNDVSCNNITPEIGITSTPVIDPVSGTIYVVAKTKEVTDGTTNFVQRLHALDVTSGAEKFGGPVVVSPTAPGTGYGQNGQGYDIFNPQTQLNRMALLLNNGTVYIGFGSHCDLPPYHGWLVGFDAVALVTNSVFNDTPNTGYGGLWEAGCGPDADTNGNVFLATGNGPFAPTNSDFGDSVVRLSTSNSALTLVDYFTPYNQQDMDDSDSDLNSGGTVLLPDAVGSGAHPHLLVAGGKQGTIYLVDRDNLGQYNSSLASNDSQIVESLIQATGGIFGTPAYFNNTLYYLGAGDVLKAFSIANGQIATNPVAQGATTFNWPGATPSISANGTNNGIVWLTQVDGNGDPAILHAENAANVAQELYVSAPLAGSVKFTAPTVANGKVYVGAQYALTVFGLTTVLPTPVITPVGGTYTNSVQVSLADGSTNATINYTLNGTTPAATSAVYTTAITLTNSATVKALATASGFTNSAVANANFTVVIITNPSAAFVASPTNGPSFLLVGFTDNSVGLITNRAWHFGDGATTNTTLTSLTHLYTNAGTYTVSLKVSGLGGSSTLNQPGLIGVSPAPPNPNPPVILSIPAYHSGVGTNGEAALPDYTAGTQATDTITPSNELLRTQSPLAGTEEPVGTTTVVVVIGDAAGNSATGTSTFVVIDSAAPIILACAPPVTNSANANCQAAVPNLGAAVQAIDYVTPSNQLVRTQSPVVGTLVGTGSTTVTITIVDAASNFTECVSEFVVVDTSPPVISSCGMTVTNIANAANQAAVPDFTAGVQVTDNCTPGGSLLKSQLPVAGTVVEAGTTPVTVSVQDAVGNIATCPADFVVINTNRPTILSPPAVTNALSQIGNLAVVVTGDTNVFNVAASDFGGPPLSYQWYFGDGLVSALSTQSLAQHIYGTNCGPYAASVVVSNSNGAVSSNLIVTVACDMAVTKPLGSLSLAVDFAATNKDTASLTARLDLGPAFAAPASAGTNVTVVIGGVPIEFVLDSKGRGVTGSSTCRLAYSKPSKTKAAYWSLQVKFNKGTWRVPWEADGLVNQTIKSPGVSVTVPVVVILNDFAYFAEPALPYTATAGKSGKVQ
jgi:PKD repeat protein